MGESRYSEPPATNEDCGVSRMARHEIMEYLSGREPDGIVGTIRFIEVQQCFTDWCFDLAEALEIEDEVDVVHAIDELECAGILSLNMADPGDDYITCVEFRQPLSPSQLLIPFSLE